MFLLATLTQNPVEAPTAPVVLTLNPKPYKSLY